MKIARSVLLAVLLLTGLASSQIFTLTDLGPDVIPSGINIKGQVSATSNHTGAQFWSKETGFVDLASLPDLPVTFAFGINNRGDVVGNSEEEESQTTHAALWPHKGGDPIDLGASETRSTDGNSINDARQVTGNLGSTRSFLWTPKAGLVDIGPAPSGILFYEATAISEQGTIVGSMGDESSSTAFFWTKATGIQPIPIPSSFATGINGHFVIGVSSCLKPNLCDNSSQHAFIWNRHLGSFDLGTLPGDNVSGASGINSFLQVVGASQNNTTGTSKAFFWSPGFRMIDLNRLVQAPGWVLNYATSINDRGQIVGYGTLNGELHGFLLTVSSRRHNR